MTSYCVVIATEGFRLCDGFMTLKEGILWYTFQCLVAMVTELFTHFILQWYATHTMLCNGVKCIPVLIFKS